MVKLTEDQFGLYTVPTTGKTIPVRVFTWENVNKISVQVITYGATITSIKVPNKNGIIEDIVTGFDDLKGFQKPENPYFGATIGRMANRIGSAQISYNNTIINVTKNIGENQLHGGLIGFDKVLWEPYVDGNKLILSYHSADLEEGYPGDLVVHTSYELTDTNELLVDFKAVTTKPTFVNLTNHSYFNLAGHDKGATELYKHVVSINADRVTETDSDSIPTGKLLPVAGTTFDLRIPKTLGDVIHKVPGLDGFDNNFCVTKGEKQGNAFIARVVHPDSGRVLEVYSNQPGVQFYTSNYFPDNPATFKGDKSKLTTLQGKGGVKYYKHGAFCLETQVWPDAPNHKDFPSALLLPGKSYHHTVAYKLSIAS